jgi:hypothetical protein
MTLPAVNPGGGVVPLDPGKLIDNPPFKKDIRLAETYIAGMMFVEGSDEIVRNMRKGDRLELRREPHNHYDRNAIAVLDADGIRIGYIPRKTNPIAAGLMDSGKRLYCTVSNADAFFGDLGVTIELMMEDL